jgi:hypothetical protein
MNSAPAVACFSCFTCLPPIARHPHAIPSHVDTHLLAVATRSSCRHCLVALPVLASPLRADSAIVSSFPFSVPPPD